MNDEQEVESPEKVPRRHEWLVDWMVFGGLVLTAIGVGCYSIPAAAVVVGVILMGIGFWALR